MYLYSLFLMYLYTYHFYTVQVLSKTVHENGYYIMSFITNIMESIKIHTIIKKNFSIAISHISDILSPIIVFSLDFSLENEIFWKIFRIDWRIILTMMLMFLSKEFFNMRKHVSDVHYTKIKIIKFYILSSWKIFIQGINLNYDDNDL